MLLCLDVGNTQVHGGVFKDNELKFQFRKNSSLHMSSDELGIFLRTVLRENDIDQETITDVSICSVVPHIDRSLHNACLKYFTENILFLKPGVKTGLNIKYLNPSEVGADRIAGAIGAREAFPEKDLLIVDFGTATTVDVVSKEGEYRGGVIFGGAQLMVSALEGGTAKLPSIQILEPEKVCGQTTAESMQSGIYWSLYGGIREILNKLSEEQFYETPVVIGTGGLAKLYENTDLFETQIPDLVLRGLKSVYVKNHGV